MTGSNLGGGAITARETARLRRSLPLHVRALGPALNALRLVEKALAGAYRQRFPLSYQVYVGDALDARAEFSVDDASFRWREA